MAKGLMIASTSGRAGLGLFALVGFLVCGRAPAQAQQFSADLSIRQGDGLAAVAGKLRVFDARVRIETPELADGFFLIDGATPAAYFVRPAARVLMEARQSSRLTRLFVQVDSNNPCRQWQVMATLAGVADPGDWRCERTSEEIIGSRRVIVYRAVSTSGREFYGWIDPALKFPLRIRTEDGAVITAENISDEPQPAGLFDAPRGFQKFDPEVLIRQIKRSDVWVADEKETDPSHP
jgi:hypothetical protein